LTLLGGRNGSGRGRTGQGRADHLSPMRVFSPFTSLALLVDLGEFISFSSNNEGLGGHGMSLGVGMQDVDRVDRGRTVLYRCGRGVWKLDCSAYIVIQCKCTH